MNTEELNRNINLIREESKKIHAIHNDDTKIFEYINNLSKDRIDELLKLYGTSTKLVKQSSNEASSVNIVRYVTLRQLKAGAQISIDSVEKIKQAFINKDIDFFKHYLDESIVKQIGEYSKKDPYGKLWNKSFALLHPFLIAPNDFWTMLKQITSSLLGELDIADYMSNEFDFTGARNEGTPYSWFAIFPKKLKNHQKAYRLTCMFDNGVLTAYLDAGREIIKEESKRNIEKNVCENYQNLILNFKKWKEKLLQLNETLLKETNIIESEITENDEGEQTNTDIPLNQILYGPPGTGKTRNTVIKALQIIGGSEIERLLKNYKTDENIYSDLFELYKNYKEKKYIRFITFHQNYSYEEFIEGITPDLDAKEGKLSYKLGKGPLKEIKELAEKDRKNKYILIIDEINRGNISKIFGELITLLEKDKRDGNEYPISIPLMYSKKEFSLPNNLYIIGTMNTADKSIALVDVALRRRFAFTEMMPQAELIEENIDGVRLQTVFKALNKKITILLDRDHQIGHSYFLNIENLKQLKNKWFKEIIPLLNEYFYGDWEKLKVVLSGSFIKKVQEELLKDIIEESWTFKDENEIDDTQFINELNNIAI